MPTSTSTGPRSSTGKLNASRNAIKDGLTARRFLNEDERREFEEIMTDLIKEYDPETKSELIQIERIATTTTRLRRVISVEDAKYKLARYKYLEGAIPMMKISNNSEFQPRKSEEQIIEQAILQKNAVLPDPHTLEMIHRMQISLSRQLSREFGELFVMVDRREKRAEKLGLQSTTENEVTEAYDDDPREYL